jgi:putative sterol carrier protein
LQKLSSVSAGLTKPSAPKNNSSNAHEKLNTVVSDNKWGKRLQDILESEFKDEDVMDDEACGLYKLEIMDDTDSVNEQPHTSIYYIEMNATNRCVRNEISSEKMLDISITISSEDLTGILDGSLSPLHAYLTGRISVDGDVRKLMLLNKISERSHKPGTTFNV